MNGGTLTGAGSAASSETNARLIERFYTAFGRRDVDAMLGCYHPQVVFSDPVFGTLAAADTAAMWRMLNGRARDLRVEPVIPVVGHRQGTTGTRTGKPGTRLPRPAARFTTASMPNSTLPTH